MKLSVTKYFQRLLNRTGLLLLFAFVISPVSLFADISIGADTTTNQHIPVEPFYNYSYSQVIYLQSDISTACVITSLSWFFDGSSLSNSNNWTIYIGHTSKSEFTNTTDWIENSLLTQVWSGTFDVQSDSGWIEFDISDFSYNNTENLVIAVDENATGYNSSDNDFYSSNVSGMRSIYFNSDETNPNPASPPSANGTSGYISNIILGTASVTPSTQSSNISFSNTSTYSTDISWDRGDGAYCATFMYQGNSGSAVPEDDVSYIANSSFGSGSEIGSSGWYCVCNGTGSNVTVTNLLPNITYRVHICEYNGNGDEKYLSSTADKNPKNVDLTEIKIVSSDIQENDLFGRSVSIDGNYAIVGAYGEDSGGSNAGAAYIFFREGENWVEQAKLVSSDFEANDHFGYSVAICGDYAIVGAPADNNINGNVSGSAYIFNRNAEGWIEQAKLNVSEQSDSTFFGHSVSISGDYAVVGAPGKVFGVHYAGAAYIFKRDNDIWSLQSDLISSDAEARDSLGFSVSISGDYVFVGAFNEDEGGYKAGAAYVFHRKEDTWSQQTKLISIDSVNSVQQKYQPDKKRVRFCQGFETW